MGLRNKLDIRDQKIEAHEKRNAFMKERVTNLAENGPPILHFFKKGIDRNIIRTIFEYADLLPPSTRENKSKV